MKSKARFRAWTCRLPTGCGPHAGASGSIACQRLADPPLQSILARGSSGWPRRATVRARRSASISTAPLSPTSGERVTFETLLASFGLAGGCRPDAHGRDWCVRWTWAQIPWRKEPALKPCSPGRAKRLPDGRRAPRRDQRRPGFVYTAHFGRESARANTEHEWSDCRGDRSDHRRRDRDRATLGHRLDHRRTGHRDGRASSGVSRSCPSPSSWWPRRSGC